MIICLLNTIGIMGQSTAGDTLFNDLQIHNIYISFSQPGYWTLLTNNKAYDDANDSSTYIPATVTIDGTVLDSVGVQFKGNSSYYNYPTNKKPFTLSFNEYIAGQKYDNLKNINLNNFYQDPTEMREKLFLDFANQMGLNAPRANYAKLYINGTYWGMYLMVERINKTFANDRFGNNGGNLFKGDKGTSACADLKYHGSMSSYYNCYDLKTNEVANDWSDLVNLTDQINNTTAAQFKDSVDNVLNTNSFIGAWAAYNMLVDFDSYPYRFIHNYYIYHNTTTNKFEWIIWDVSTAFGMDVPGTVSQIENTSVLYITPNASDRPLVERMLADTNYKTTYLTYQCEYIEYFQPSVLNPKIDSIYNLISTDVYAETLNMYSDSDFDNNINGDITIGPITYPGLKSFILNRSSNIQNELNSLGVNCSDLLGENTNLISDFEVGVYPNPSDGNLNIVYSLNNNSYISMSLIDCLGQTTGIITGQYQLAGGHQTSLNLSNTARGSYFLKLTIDGNSYFKKIIIQ